MIYQDIHCWVTDSVGVLRKDNLMITKINNYLIRQPGVGYWWSVLLDGNYFLHFLNGRIVSYAISIWQLVLLCPTYESTKVTQYVTREIFITTGYFYSSLRVNNKSVAERADEINFVCVSCQWKKIKFKSLLTCYGFPHH